MRIGHVCRTTSQHCHDDSRLYICRKILLGKTIDLLCYRLLRLIIFLVLWKFSTLFDFTENIKQALEVEIDSISEMNIEAGTNTTLLTGIESQITALESAVDSVENFKSALEAGEVLLWVAAAVSLLECVLCIWLQPMCLNYPTPKRITASKIRCIFYSPPSLKLRRITLTRW